MTPLRTAAVAAALLAVSATSSCSSGSDTADSATGSTATAAAEPVDDPTTASSPGPDICAITTEWARIDALLIEGNRQSPPAPAYQDAALQISAVFPPESIKAQLVRLRDLVPSYAEVLKSGTPDEIAAAADEATEIAGITSQLSAAFASLCG